MALFNNPVIVDLLAKYRPIAAMLAITQKSGCTLAAVALLLPVCPVEA